MASEWNLWVWLECIDIVSGCCCKEAYRYPHIIITYHYWQHIFFFDKLVCRSRIIKERLSACHMATATEIILISEFHALH